MASPNDVSVTLTEIYARMAENAAPVLRQYGIPRRVAQIESWIDSNPGGGGGGSVLTSKGDIATFDTADARQAVPANSNGWILTPDDTQPTGLKWTQRFANWSSSTAYDAGQVVLFNGGIYRSLSNRTSGALWDAGELANWSVVSPQQTFQVLTDAANVSWDQVFGLTAGVTVTADRTIDMATNGVTGEYSVLAITASGADRTVTFDAGYVDGDGDPIGSIVVKSGATRVLWFFFTGANMVSEVIPQASSELTSQVLVDGAAVAWDAALGEAASLTQATLSATIATPSNLVAGKFYRLSVTASGADVSTVLPGVSREGALNGFTLVAEGTTKHWTFYSPDGSSFVSVDGGAAIHTTASSSNISDPNNFAEARNGDVIIRENSGMVYKLNGNSLSVIVAGSGDAVTPSNAIQMASNVSVSGYLDGTLYAAEETAGGTFIVALTPTYPVKENQVCVIKLSANEGSGADSTFELKSTHFADELGADLPDIVLPDGDTAYLSFKRMVVGGNERLVPLNQHFGQKSDLSSQTLTYGANVSWDLSQGRQGELAATGDAIIDLPTNIALGGFYVLRVTGSGAARTITFAPGYLDADGGAVGADVVQAGESRTYWFYAGTGAALSLLDRGMSAHTSASSDDIESDVSAFSARENDIIIDASGAVYEVGAAGAVTRRLQASGDTALASNAVSLASGVAPAGQFRSGIFSATESAGGTFAITNGGAGAGSWMESGQVVVYELTGAEGAGADSTFSWDATDFQGSDGSALGDTTVADGDTVYVNFKVQTIGGVKRLVKPKVSAIDNASISASTTAQANTRYFVDTSGGSIVLTLPLIAGAPVGSRVVIIDAAGTWGSNGVTVDPNGATVNGTAATVGFTDSNRVHEFVSDGTGWQYDADKSATGLHRARLFSLGTDPAPPAIADGVDTLVGGWASSSGVVGMAPNLAGSKVVIAQDGLYKVDFRVVTTSGGEDATFSLYVDGAAVEGVTTQATASDSTNYVASFAPIALSAGAEVSIFGQQHGGSAAFNFDGRPGVSMSLDIVQMADAVVPDVITQSSEFLYARRAVATGAFPTQGTREIVDFDTIDQQSGDSISLDAATGIFTLKGGSTYRVGYGNFRTSATEEYVLWDYDLDVAAVDNLANSSTDGAFEAVVSPVADKRYGVTLNSAGSQAAADTKPVLFIQKLGTSNLATWQATDHIQVGLSAQVLPGLNNPCTFDVVPFNEGSLSLNADGTVTLQADRAYEITATANMGALVTGGTLKWGIRDYTNGVTLRRTESHSTNGNHSDNGPSTISVMYRPAASVSVGIGDVDASSTSGEFDIYSTMLIRSLPAHNVVPDNVVPVRLLQNRVGSFSGWDVVASGTLAVTGDILSAVATGPTGTTGRVDVTFADMGTSDYMVNLTAEGTGAVAGDSKFRGMHIRDKTSTGFSVVVEESTGSFQSITIHIAVTDGLPTSDYIDSSISVESHFAYVLGEVLTGEFWIDGKPVFRSVIDLTGVADNTSILPSGTVDTLISISGSVQMAPSGVNFFGLPSNQSSNVANAFKNGAGELVTDLTSSATGGYLIACYTKP